MFLDVSESVRHVKPTEPNETQRKALAAAGDDALRARFKGVKKDAYSKADVNSGTWSRFEQGLVIRPDSLIAIVQVLWPESGGDWRRVDLSVGPNPEDASYVAAPGARVEDGVGNEAVLRAIEQMRQDMQDMERRLSERMDGFEQSGS